MSSPLHPLPTKSHTLFAGDYFEELASANRQTLNTHAEIIVPEHTAISPNSEL